MEEKEEKNETCSPKRWNDIILTWRSPLGLLREKEKCRTYVLYSSQTQSSLHTSKVVLISSSSMASTNFDDDPINDIEDGASESSTEVARRMDSPTEAEPSAESPTPEEGPTTAAPGRRDADNDPAADPDAELGGADSTIVIRNATLFHEEAVFVATPIVPWWKQRSGRALLGTALVLLAALGAAVGSSSSSGGIGGPTPEEVDLIRERGTHGTCPSDESARDCGATLEIWMDVWGWSVMNLVVATDNLTLPPNRTERLLDTLSGPVNMADNYGCRMSGWLVPPITSDEYVIKILVDDEAELWLSADDDPVNKAKVAIFFQWTREPELKSGQLSFVAGRSYYFEVREMD